MFDDVKTSIRTSKSLPTMPLDWLGWLGLGMGSGEMFRLEENAMVRASQRQVRGGSSPTSVGKK